MMSIWPWLIGSAVMMAVVFSKPIDNTTQKSIEIRVFVDRWALKRWTAMVATSSVMSEKINETKAAITDYVYSVFNDVNSIFKELMRYGINLDVRVHSLNFIEENAIAPDAKLGFRHMDPVPVVQNLFRYLWYRNYSYIEHVMLFTGLAVKKIHRHLYSYTCSNYPLSVLEATPSGSAALSMAYQQALYMLVELDGQNNLCGNNYIMTAVDGPSSPTNFRFSDCSLASIKAFVLLEDNCVSAAETTTPPVSAPALGERYTPDDICKLTFGNTSYFCRSLYGYGGQYTYDSMCLEIYCKRESGRCAKVQAPDGFVCGKDKQCSLGECKPSLSSFSGSSPASVAADKCPQGDSPVANDEGQTCSQAVSASRSKCYNGEFQRSCCDSCHRAATGPTGCQYGDMTTSCGTSVDTCTSWLSPDLCCESCHSNNTDVAENVN